MKKETTYSLILALVNLCVWFMSKYVNLYYQILDKELDGMPYPPLTKFMKDSYVAWSLFFIIMFLVIAVISIKKSQLAYHLMFATIITEIIFLSVLVVSCILPLIPHVSLNNSHNPVKGIYEKAEGLE